MTPTAEEQQAFQAFLSARDDWDVLYTRRTWFDDEELAELLPARAAQLRAARDRLIEVSSGQSGKALLSPECECYDGSHWHEDTYGNETRVDCGCPCEKCREF